MLLFFFGYEMNLLLHVVVVVMKDHSLIQMVMMMVVNYNVENIDI